jgi:hypothetical protein
MCDGKMGPNDGPRLMLRRSSFEQNRRQPRSARRICYRLTEDAA